MKIGSGPARPPHPPARNSIHVPTDAGPVTLPQGGEFFLPPAGRSTVDVLQQLGRSYVSGRRYEHVNMIGRYRSANHYDFPRMTYLPNQIAGTLRHFAAQNLVTVLSDPHQVIFGHRMPLCRYSAIPSFRREPLKADRLSRNCWPVRPEFRGFGWAACRSARAADRGAWFQLRREDTPGACSSVYLRSSCGPGCFGGLL